MLPLRPCVTIRYREYNTQDLDNLRFIRNARHLGFTVKDVTQILEHAEHGDSPCPLVRETICKRMTELKHQIQREQELLGRMQSALQAWETMEDGEPDGHSVCRLIEEVSATNTTSGEKPSKQ